MGKLFSLVGQIVVIYFLYKLIFDFIIPFYKASKQVKSNINEFKAKAQQQASQQQQFQQQQQAQQQPTKQAPKEYIEFEEVK
jgi:Sec-independent protein translocase protein TatA